MKKSFFFPVRIYYEDTDHGGVVYYANYLKYMERARTELLRAKGYEQDLLIDKENLIFAVRSVNVDYVKSAVFNNLLLVVTEISEASKIAFTFAQTIYQLPNCNQTDHAGALTALPGDAVLLCRGQIKVVALDAQTMKPKRMNQSMVREITSE